MANLSPEDGVAHLDSSSTRGAHRVPRAKHRRLSSWVWLSRHGCPSAYPPSAIGIIVALCVFIWQIRRARFNQSIDLLFRLENDFFSPAKRLRRVKAARQLLQGQTLEAEPILDFFETMALLLRRKALDKEIVWHTFFYWIDRYFQATHEHITERQKIDPLVWKDFVRFVAELREFQAARPGAPSYVAPDPMEIVRFLNEELTEAA